MIIRIFQITRALNLYTFATTLILAIVCYQMIIPT